jgi:urease alpha subunit
MSKFEIGDKVRLADTSFSFTVEVLGFDQCDEDDCVFGGELFRFKDPVSGEDDWMHSTEFEKAP